MHGPELIKASRGHYIRFDLPYICQHLEPSINWYHIFFIFTGQQVLKHVSPFLFQNCLILTMVFNRKCFSILSPTIFFWNHTWSITINTHVSILCFCLYIVKYIPFWNKCIKLPRELWKRLLACVLYNVNFT